MPALLTSQEGPSIASNALRSECPRESSTRRLSHEDVNDSNYHRYSCSKKTMSSRRPGMTTTTTDSYPRITYLHDAETRVRLQKSPHVSSVRGAGEKQKKDYIDRRHMSPDTIIAIMSFVIRQTSSFVWRFVFCFFEFLNYLTACFQCSSFQQYYDI